MWWAYNFYSVLRVCRQDLLLSAAPIQGSPQRMFSNIRTEDLAVFYAGCPSSRNLLIVGKLSQAFLNVLGCTLEGNQLRHCAAKPIASGCHSKHKWVFTPGVLRSRDQSIMSRTHYPLSHWGSVFVGKIGGVDLVAFQ